MIILTNIHTPYRRMEGGGCHTFGPPTVTLFERRGQEICFPVDWLNSSVQVFFDFLGVVLTDAPEAQRQPLWCLHPKREDGNAVVTEMSRESFVEIATNGPPARQAPVQPAVNNMMLPAPRMIVDPRFLKDISRLIPGLIQRPPRRRFRRL